MSSPRRTIFALAIVVAFLCTPLLAQPVGSGSTNKSPVALFRELLVMNPAQREQAIASHPPGTQKRILEKLEEYELYPPELRELRLRETELRWYLRPLMDEPRANRPNALAQVPQELRNEVEQRLQLWDLLPPPLQDELRDKDLIASYFAQTRSTPEQLAVIMRLIPPERRVVLEKGLDSWQAMSEDDRQKALAGFNKFFELTPEQKEKTLDAVSDEDRSQMDQTLAAYAHLTPAQRAQCIRSFEKFARMNVAERQQFLKNAERWKEMTPEERERWRQLVITAPIMPTANPPSLFPGVAGLPSVPVATN